MPHGFSQSTIAEIFGRRTKKGKSRSLDAIVPPEQQSIQRKCFHPNGTFLEFTADQLEQTITERFELQVARHPDRVAVHAEEGWLRYDALNRRANAVAAQILARVGEGNEPVALCLSQGTSAITAALGVLKTGRCYVPLDPSYPRSRLRSILEDSGAVLVLADSVNLSLAENLASGQCARFNIDELADLVTSENIHRSSSPEAIAAIFYTSGSTGRPKGVMQSHRSVLHRVMIHTNSYHICADDHLSLLCSPIYSFSLRNLFGALLNGAAVCPLDMNGSQAAPLGKWLEKEKVTIYASVPTLFRHLIGTLTGEEDLRGVRLVNLAGEGVGKKDVEAYKKHFSPKCIFVNSLSSNEAGIIRQYFIDKQTEIAGAAVPAGFAVEGKEVVIVDDARQSVALGEAGEIAVKSRYVAPGYWRQPSLTAMRFLPDPEDTTRRIYLTGDIGRMLPDGSLLYFGRKGTNVKIHGADVDLAEVETVLREHAAIKEAAVVVNEDSSGARLCAYVVPAAEAAPPALAELREYLRQILPAYMIPSAFVFLSAMPLTPNGKIDRRSLPPASYAPRHNGPYVAARSALENRIIDIWREVLRVDAIGIHDNFFDLGGDSLLLIEAHVKLAGLCTKTFSVTDLFAYPTIHSLAGFLRADSEKDATAPGRDRAVELRAGLDRLRQQFEARREKK